MARWCCATLATRDSVRRDTVSGRGPSRRVEGDRGGMRNKNGRGTTPMSGATNEAPANGSAIAVGGTPLPVAPQGKPLGQVDDRFGATPSHGRRIQDVEIAQSPV